MTSRRRFLAAGAASLASLSTAGWNGAFAQAAPDLGAPTLPENGVRRIPLGDAELLAINDGAARRPLTEGFVRNAALADVKSALAAGGLSQDYLEISFTAFVVITPRHRILMDTGNGEFGGPTSGRLLANLAQAGIAPESIDTVLISHFHGDHINGLRRRDGGWVFPKAQVMVPAAEWGFWMDDARMAAAPDAMKGAFQNVRRVFGPVADKLRRFEPGSELVSGVKALPAPGHTPGHTLFEVTGRERRFVYLADLSNIPALFVRQPEWSVQFDMDAELARQTRRRVLEEVAESKALVGGYHFPFPAVGSIVKDGAGFDFDPFRVT
ncbi:MBL fold metallo-hydrolase [Piscinibacter sakaiensis]|uniref:Metallo-beta-lactamase domain-containing protein n=1 Tax=Piscinibacter sakaiensis TaxID=1547922 RepID=A0A0K8P5H9_PISS1|nr:MBL fold metallo-hydrolase [Piscinibacter sakaiensis]GAP37846.1 hypothetical protein ISF6_3791 [Piscinibacter sakaiensis]